MEKFTKIFILLFFLSFTCPSYGLRKGSFRTRVGTHSNTKVKVTKIKQKVNIRYERPWGSGTRYSSWNSYGNSGHIYGYFWYVNTPYYRNNRHKEPAICRNEFDNQMDNGTHYQWFICPTKNHTWDNDRCCGAKDHQQCCTSKEYYKSRGSSGNSLVSSIVGPIVGILLLFCCCGVCAKVRHKNRMNRNVVNQTFVENITITQGAGGQVPYQAPYLTGQAVPPPNQSPYPPSFEPQPAQHPYPQPYPQPQAPYPTQQPPYPPQGPYPQGPYPQGPYPPPNQPPYPSSEQAPFVTNQAPYPPNQPPNPIMPPQPPPYSEMPEKFNPPSAPPL